MLCSIILRTIFFKQVGNQNQKKLVGPTIFKKNYLNWCQTDSQTKKKHILWFVFLWWFSIVTSWERERQTWTFYFLAKRSVDDIKIQGSWPIFWIPPCFGCFDWCTKPILNLSRNSSLYWLVAAISAEIR